MQNSLVFEGNWVNLLKVNEMTNLNVSRNTVSTFLFCMAIVCLLAASMPGYHYAVWWIGICSLVFFGLAQKETEMKFTSVGIALVLFGLLLLFNSLFVSPIYIARGLYLPLSLLVAFFAASVCPKWLIDNGFKWCVGVMLLIACWAIVQSFTGLGFLGKVTPRGEALFGTPNTLASAINVFLLPIICYYVLGRGGRFVYSASLLLFAALIGSQSKGGLLALIVTLIIFGFIVGYRSLLANKQRITQVTLGFIAVLGIFKINTWISNSTSGIDRIGKLVENGDTARLSLYESALQALPDNFLSGIGYFNFGYYYETLKSDGVTPGSTFFVHNDYLQFALETGIFGILLFLLVIALLYWHVFKFRNQLGKPKNLSLLMSLVAVTTLFTHAMVDFPFYIPFLLPVFGLFMGIINRQLQELGVASYSLPSLSNQFSNLNTAFANKLILAMTMGWFMLPAAAEVSAAYGLYQLKHLDGKSGLYWHAIARELQPKDSMYYWREAVIWRDLGITLSNKEYLKKSDELFAGGAKVNAFEVRNLLDRAALYRNHSALLEQDNQPEGMVGWINLAKQLRPKSAAVQMEYIRTLAFLGQQDNAMQLAQAFIKRFPKSNQAKDLLAEVSAK